MTHDPFDPLLKQHPVGIDFHQNNWISSRLTVCWFKGTKCQDQEKQSGMTQRGVTGSKPLVIWSALLSCSCCSNTCAPDSFFASVSTRHQLEYHCWWFHFIWNAIAAKHCAVRTNLIERISLSPTIVCVTLQNTIWHFTDSPMFRLQLLITVIGCWSTLQEPTADNVLHIKSERL